ncbi:DddA-like double-stranded DNA deaminase toxin [Actinosynnema sp. NPDC023587]|uniref:DddA-like double-stranded DNA deaminase toxin n=1 Tax=Actinosynnema sp. NPDC023587 TaxID=3154695 RepID=UPI0033F3450C
MATLAEVVAAVRNAGERAEDAAIAFQQARDLARDAADLLDNATSGAYGLEADSAQAVAALRETVSGIDDLVGLLRHATALAAQYAARLGSAASSVGEGGAAEVDDDLEWSRRQRTGLPRYVTSGYLVDEDGHRELVQSGAEPDGEHDRITDHLKSVRAVRPFGRPTVVEHVEVKAAWRLRNSASTHATVIVNNRLCDGPLSCRRMIPAILRPGQTLTVYDPDGRHPPLHGKVGP